MRFGLGADQAQRNQPVAERADSIRLSARPYLLWRVSVPLRRWVQDGCERLALWV